MWRLLFSLLTGVALVVVQLSPSLVLAGYKLDNAQGLVGTAAGRAGVEQTDIGTIVGSGIRGALQLVGIFFFILMLYGGIVWMTARGNEERVTKAKNTIWAAIIGVSITVAAYAITLFAARILATRPQPSATRCFNIPTSPAAQGFCDLFTTEGSCNRADVNRDNQPDCSWR